METCILPSLSACLAKAGPLEQAKFALNILGLLSLVGILAALLSMRVTVCNQIYTRWQALIFKFADAPTAHEYLAKTTYNKLLPRNQAHFIAVAYLNLFEEAYRYHKSRILFIVPVMPNAFWMSIENSMKKQFEQFEYLRTFWNAERSSFSGDFNDYVQTSVRPLTQPQ